MRFSMKWREYNIGKETVRPKIRDSFAEFRRNLPNVAIYADFKFKTFRNAVFIEYRGNRVDNYTEIATFLTNPRLTPCYA